MNQEYVKDYYKWEDLLAVVKKLRDEDGCPWDREQTHESLEKCMRDECQEVIDAVNNRDYLNLREELGDVMLQVLMHARIAAENDEFTLEDVINQLGHKLVTRHPHVFGDGGHTDDVNTGLSKWNQAKVKEKLERLEEYRQWVAMGKIEPEVLEKYSDELIKKGILEK